MLRLGRLRLRRATAMPRVVPGVRPRVKDANGFYAAGRVAVLNPLFDAVRERLRDVDSLARTASALSFLRGHSVSFDFVSSSLDEVELYHAARFAQTFRRALSVDVRPFLTRPEVAAALRVRVDDSVRLIRTIPRRLHADLLSGVRSLFDDAPFDRAMLGSLLRDEFRSSGFNLRRITRDQSSKFTGALSEIRQRQVGVTRYRWLSSGDERVRDAHRLNNGRLFDWSSPPSTGHPGSDVLCRCVALPVVDAAPVGRDV